MVDVVVVRPDRVQLLVRVPAGISRHTVARGLRSRLTWSLRAVGVAPWAGRIFAERYWSVVLTNAAAVAAVRHHVRKEREADHAPSRGAPAPEIPVVERVRP